MSDKNIVKKGNPMIDLIEDLDLIHEKTDFRIDEVDDKVNKTIALVQQGKMAMLPHLEDLRLELWINYTEESIFSIDDYIKSLAHRLVKVSKYKCKFNNIKRDFDKIQNETNNFKLLTKLDYLPKLFKLFNDASILWNDLIDNEEDLNFLARNPIQLRKKLDVLPLGRG